MRVWGVGGATEIRCVCYSALGESGMFWAGAAGVGDLMWSLSLLLPCLPPSLSPAPPPQVLQPASLAGRQGGGFAPAHVITEVSLLYKRVMITAGRRPVRAWGDGRGVGGVVLFAPAHVITEVSLLYKRVMITAEGGR